MGQRDFWNGVEDTAQAVTGTHLLGPTVDSFTQGMDQAPDSGIYHVFTPKSGNLDSVKS